MTPQQPYIGYQSIGTAVDSWSSSRPRVFVGSSKEGRPLAERLHALLTEFARPRLWPSVFRLSQNFLDDILREAHECEFGVFLMTADDLVAKRGEIGLAVRDNVLFEFGVFLGARGKDRAFFVFCGDNPPELPTDLLGLTGAVIIQCPLSDASDMLRPIALKIRDSITRVMPISPLRDRESDIRAMMQSAIKSIARVIPGARSEDIGAHIWWLDSDKDARLTRVLRVHTGSNPPNDWAPWRRGQGVVGSAWEQDNTVWLDLGNSQIQAVASPDGFIRLPDDLRLGVSYETFQITRRDFRAIWATPIHDPQGPFLGVLSLNVDKDIHMPATE